MFSHALALLSGLWSLYFHLATGPHFRRSKQGQSTRKQQHQTPAQVVAGAGARHYWRWGRLGPPPLILLLVHLERRWGNSTSSSASLLVRVSVLPPRSQYIIITVAIDQVLTMVRWGNLQLKQDSTEAPASIINWAGHAGQNLYSSFEKQKFYQAKNFQYICIHSKSWSSRAHLL